MLYTSQILALLTTLVENNIKHWGFGAHARVALLHYSENATFIMNDRGSKRIFRVYRPNYHSNTEILSELHFMQHVEQAGTIILPHIYKTQEGKFFLKIIAHGYEWRMACFSYLEGYEPKILDNLPQWFERLGGLAAKLHQITVDWPQNNDKITHCFTRKHWTYETMIGPNAYWGNWRAARLNAQDKAVLEICDTTLKNAYEKIKAVGNKVALLHADLRLANLLIQGKNLAIIDFDDCGFAYHGLDFANAISFIEHEPIVVELQEQWLNGYAKVMPLDQKLIDTLPHLIMMRRMQLTAWLISHNETETAKQLNNQFSNQTVDLAKLYLEKIA